MAWNKVTDIDYTKQPNPHLKSGYSAMVTGHYYVNFKGTLWVDSNNNAHYRVRATMKVAPYRSKYGGYWTGNDGTGIDVYFSDSDGDHSILHKSISSSSYPISAWETAGVYVTVDTVDTEFIITKKGTLNLYIQLFQGGAGRVGSSSWVVDGKRVTSSDGFSGTYSNFIDYKIPDPYKTPTISISANNDISNYNESRSINISSNTSGDNSPTTVKVKINNYETSSDLGNNSGNFNFKPSDYNVSEGSYYNVSARRTHNLDTKLYKDSNVLTLYTYRLPTIINFSLDPSAISGDAKNSPLIKWACNNRRWENKEKQFKTYITRDNGSSWIDIGVHGPNTSNVSNIDQYKVITRTFLESLTTIQERSGDFVKLDIKLRRKNESSGKVADTDKLPLIINYKPTKAIDINNIWYYDCNTDNKTPDITKPLIARKLLLYR